MNQIRQTTALLFIAALFAIFAYSCGGDDLNEPSSVYTNASAHKFDNKVFIEWNNLFLKLDRQAQGFRPCPAPRALGYLGLSAYESVVAGIPENKSLASQFPGLILPAPDSGVTYYWPACVNESYAYLMRRFFFQIKPELLQEIELKRQALHEEFTKWAPSKAVLEQSEQYGREVAAAVYEWSATDIYAHNAQLDPQPSGYMPSSDPGMWKPTYPDNFRALFPYFGNARTFALPKDKKLAQSPLPFSENNASLFYAQALETYDAVNTIKAGGPQAFDMLWAAEFWNDENLDVTFSPGSRFISIATQVVEKEKVDLAVAAELYAKLGLALNDACVAVWHSKYHYNRERPVSYIRRVLPAMFPDAANWTTLLDNPYANIKGFTPASPTYPSEHSGFANAGASILSSFFEYNDKYHGPYLFTDFSHATNSAILGSPRTFTSFQDAAVEATFSRIPIGVHFRMDCEAGYLLGGTIAKYVLELPWKK